MTKHTIGPGTFVRVDGLSEADFIAVGEAFIDAGCQRGHWDRFLRDLYGIWPILMWDHDDDVCGVPHEFHDQIPQPSQELLADEILNR